jgi:hypothetical protein
MVGALLLAPAVVVAQDPPPVDTLVADSVDIRPDSTSTERLLAVQGNQDVRLTTLRPVEWAGVQPAGSRIVLTRDSIDWSPARTIGELIGASAPVYLWRGGWRVRPELPNYLGRGATSVEYEVDGLPWIALGPDSLAVDPSLWTLDMFERVEIERGPSRLKVHIYTRNYDRLAPRTKIGVETGDRGFARYYGSFERRWPRGFALGMAADYVGVDAPNNGTGAANITNGWIQASWMPSSRLAMQAQLMVQVPNRDLFLREGESEAADSLDPGLEGTRQVSQFRISWGNQRNPLGLHLDGWAARSVWDSDSLRHDIGTYGAQLSYRRPTWSADLRALHNTEWTPLDLRLALGWSPFTNATVSIEGVRQDHDNDRRSEFGTARMGFDVPRGSRLLLGLRMPASLRLGAAASYGERVDVPAITEMSVASFADYEVMAGVDFGRLAVEGRVLSTDVWQPLPFRNFATVAGFARQDRTEWVAVKAHLAPTSWFSVASHYEHPLRGATPDGVPPNHAWTTATVNSRFLRNFPSGIFRLKVQGVVESWSPGVIGRDIEGEPIELRGLTFVRGVVQLQLGPFIAFWDRVNFQGTRQGHVPGFPILSLGSSYGIRWEFKN